MTMLCKWEELPVELQNPSVKPYYDRLDTHRKQLLLKRIFDICISLCGVLFLSPIFLITAIAIKLDTPGPVFYRQERITQYGRVFKIFKFRSMVSGAKTGANLTVNNDSRITKTGKFIRKFKIDELCQLLDVLVGNMTLVGTRPEVKEYVDEYTPEMMATLLLPAGVTSLTSIYYAGEAKILEMSDDPEKAYVEDVLPGKMKWNLRGIEKFSFCSDIKIMFMTFFAMLGKEYKAEE